MYEKNFLITSDFLFYFVQLFESAHSSPPLTKSNPTSPDVMTQQPTSFSAMNSFRVPPIQIAALSGTSEVKMKMKQNEAVSGPKVNTIAEKDHVADFYLFALLVKDKTEVGEI